MQPLDDDERKEVLGSVLADELKAIHEFVSVIPSIQQLHKMQATMDDHTESLTVIEHVSKRARNRYKKSETHNRII